MISQKYLKYFPDFLREDRLILISLTSSFVINIIIWILLLSKFGISSDPAPLHFSVVYGINYVGPSYQVYQLPLVGLVVLGLNWYFAKAVYDRFKLMSYFLTLTVLFVQIVLLLAGVSLFFLNR